MQLKKVLRKHKNELFNTEQWNNNNGFSNSDKNSDWSKNNEVSEFGENNWVHHAVNNI